jgi:SHS2 domain-containing protein
MQKYQFLDHPSDIKLRAFGKDLPELFINAASGMNFFLYGSFPNTVIKITHKIIIEADNLESLLIDWLGEILWLTNTKHGACVDYQIKEFAEKKIVAKVVLKPATAKDDIKAVTYHELKIAQADGQWVAEIVFDI